jgi:hypothetical protein
VSSQRSALDRQVLKRRGSHMWSSPPVSVLDSVQVALNQAAYTGTEATSADFATDRWLVARFPVLGCCHRPCSRTCALLEPGGSRQTSWITDDLQPASVHGRALVVPRHVPEWLSPIPLIVPGQLLALHLALARGYDVDAPRSITKITETY